MTINVTDTLQKYLTKYPNKPTAFLIARIKEEFGDEFPIKDRMIRYRVSKLRKKRLAGNEPKAGITELESSSSADKSTFKGKINSKETDRVKILEEFLEQAQVDLKSWKVKKYILKAWDVTMKSTTDHQEPGRTYTNYYIHVDLEPIEASDFDEDEFLEFAEDMMKKYSGKAPKIKYEKVLNRVGENLLLLSINDLHLGRFTWEEECGVESNTNLAIANALRGIDEILENANTSTIDRILYYVGHDFFTIDKVRPFAATSNGTPQEVDMRWQQLFQLGEELQINIINYLSTIAPVDVQIVPGNHDLQASYYLGRTLYRVYEHNPNVNVDATAPVRKYYRWGECNVMGSHGKYEKPQDVHAVMMAEDRKNMGDTKYWFAIFGHQHHYVEQRVRTVKTTNNKQFKQVTELNEDYKGITITYLPNISHRDDYEVERAYVGTIRSAMGMLLNTVKGRTNIYQFNL